MLWPFSMQSQDLIAQPQPPVLHSRWLRVRGRTGWVPDSTAPTPAQKLPAAPPTMVHRHSPEDCLERTAHTHAPSRRWKAESGRAQPDERVFQTAHVGKAELKDAGTRRVE